MAKGKRTLFTVRGLVALRAGLAPLQRVVEATAHRPAELGLLATDIRRAREAVESISGIVEALCGLPITVKIEEA